MAALRRKFFGIMQNIGNQVLTTGEGLTSYTVSMSFVDMVYDFFRRQKELANIWMDRYYDEKLYQI